MSSVRWSELQDDSDECSDAPSSELEDFQIKQNNQNPRLPETLSLKKVVSLPPVFEKKIKKEEKLNEEVEKLKQHKNSKVWLYALDSPKNDAKVVEEILKTIDIVEKVFPMKKGWNILVKTDKAFNYIEKGIKHKDIWVRLIYSKKNENSHRPKQKDIKAYTLIKKEFLSPNSRQQRAKIVNKDIKEKKKIKYIEREIDNPQQKIALNVKNNNTLNSQIIENYEESQIKDFKNTVSYENTQELLISKNLQKELVQDKQSKQTKKQSSLSNAEKNKEDKFSDSSEELEIQRKVMEKKKKKNKKKGGKPLAFADSNNPFAVFVN